MDEQILSMRKNSAEKNQTNIIGEPVYIGKERYHFVWKPIYRNRISLLFPEEFVSLPEEAAKIKYPNENRPKELWTSLDLMTNFGFTIIEGSIPEKELPKNVREIVDLSKKLNENYAFSPVHIKNIPEQNGLRLLVWYEYISPSLTTSIYNLLAFQRIGDTLVHCVFNCEEPLGEIWRTAVLESFSSMRQKGDLQ